MKKILNWKNLALMSSNILRFLLSSIFFTLTEVLSLLFIVLYGHGLQTYSKFLERSVDFCWSFCQSSVLLLTFCWRLSQMLSIAVSSLAQLSLYISLTLYYTESKRRDARAQRFAKSKLEGAIEESWSFEPTLFINICFVHPIFYLLVFGILVFLVVWFSFWFFSVLPILPCQM